MAEINRIREAVNVLSGVTDAEWEKIEKIRSAVKFLSTITDGELKEIDRLKEKKKAGEERISYDEKERKVIEVLKMIGIPSRIKGYSYTLKALLLIMKDSEKYSKVTKELYPTIAEEFETTSAAVERGIRYAIKLSSNRGDTATINKIFGYSIPSERAKPTNTEFLAEVVDYLKRI